LLRALDKLADQEQDRSARMEKALADYQAQADSLSTTKRL
jgi:predicted transcriptional regulator